MTRNHSPRAPHRIVVLALAPVVGFDATIPELVLGGAEDSDGNPLYDVRICGLDPAGIAVTSGYAIVPHGGPELLADADTVVVPGTRHPAARTEGRLDDAVDAALRRVPAGARWVSICTGAFVLAAAGRLDHRRATTHWAYADRFRDLFPLVHLDENLLFIEDDGVWTSAGLAAGVDLCLQLLRTDHGSEVANRVARFCVVPPWREGGQSQFIDRQVPEDGSDGTAPTRAWALENLDQDLDLATLSAHARMSVRTFTRRFKSETGLAPGAWLLRQRMHHARHLLEATELPIDEVARAAGLGTAASLRHHLRGELGVPPLAYRKTFRMTTAKDTGPADTPRQ